MTPPASAIDGRPESGPPGVAGGRSIPCWGRAVGPGSRSAPRDLLMAGSAAPSADASNIQAIGQLLYTKYLFLFEAAGIILLVAMIGAIVLTHRQRLGVKRIGFVGNEQYLTD